MDYDCAHECLLVVTSLGVIKVSPGGSTRRRVYK
jgi:hypothetical protein